MEPLRPTRVDVDGAEFVQAVFRVPPAPLRIQLWIKQIRRSLYLTDPKQVTEFLPNPPRDIYVAVALAPRDMGATRRCRASEAAGIGGLWADVDVNGGPEGKTGAAPDPEAAKQLTHVILPPTLLVSSGYGVQAWWLLEEPWIFSGDAERTRAAKIATGWIALHNREAHHRGWKIDSTQDLARLMRLPETFNGKGRADAPVLVIQEDGPRYTLEELAEHALAVAPSTPTYDPAAYAGVKLRKGANPPFDKWSIAQENDPEFRRVWRREHDSRSKSWSQSEWDLSLASRAVDIGWNDQEIADLIIAYRRFHGNDVGKALRRDYVARTIGKARLRIREVESEREQEDALAELEAIGASTADQANSDRLIELFNRVLASGIEGAPRVKELRKYGRSGHARYVLAFSDGCDVTLGDATGLMVQAKFAARVLEETNHLIEPVKPRRWRDAIRALLKHALVEVTPEDESPSAEVAELAKMYIENHFVDGVDRAATQRAPFSRDGYDYIYASSMARWLGLAMRLKISTADLRVELVRAGFERVTIGYEDTRRKRRTSTSYYKRPAF